MLYFKKSDNSNLENMMGIFIFFIVSFAAVCPGWYFRPHYFQLVFPAAALLIGYGLTQFDWTIRLKKQYFKGQHFIAYGLLISIVMQSGYFFWKSPERVLNDLYNGGEYFTSFREIGESLGKKTQPLDEIGFYGSDPQLLFYAQRRNASGYMYAYPLLENQPYAELMTEQYIHENEVKKPNWFLISIVSLHEDNKKTAQRLNNWLKQYLNTHYTLMGIFYETTEKDGKGEMRWNEATIDTSRKALLYIYQRN